MTLRRLAVGLVLVASCAATAAQAHTGRAEIARPSRQVGATVAKVIVATLARSQPGGGTVLWRISTSTQWGQGPQELMVLADATDDAGHEWLAVRIPVRPNGTVGWIRADRVLLMSTPYWIDVSLGHRLVSVYRSGKLVRRFEAVVGAPATPTPRGLHAIYDPIRQSSQNGFVGTWALHLTAFSNVLDNYGGGPGRVAIHGRGGDSLKDPLGTARSHGCVRVDNADVEWLARVVPRGTPVMVRA